MTIRTSRSISITAVLLSLLLLPAVAQAAPTTLPAVEKSLSAAGTTTRTCTEASGTGTDTTAYTAPMSGYVTTRLEAPDSSDWDLVIRDVQSGLNIAASQAFGSHEVAQVWVKSGQRLIAQACHRAGDAQSARVSFVLADVTPPQAAGPVSLLRVHGTSRQLEGLDRFGIDVTENAHDGSADVLVAGSKQLDAVKGLHLPFDTRIANMNTYSANARAADAQATDSPLPSGRTTYRTLAELQPEMKKIADENAGIVRPVTIGKTFQGREIQGLEIADNVNGDDGRPVFFLMAEHHAREWPSLEAAMEYAHMLVQQQSDPRIASMLAHVRTVVVPVVNVDGYNSSRSAVSPADTLRDLNGGEEIDPTGAGLPPSTVESVAPPGGIAAYRRKNCDGEFSDNPEVPCELQYGIDPNRNYGNLWGGAGGSPDPTSQSYHGPGPRSEPEVQAVWNYARTHQVTTLISLHNVAALVLRPPGLHDGGKAPDEQRLKEIGDAMANATGYTSEFGFQLYDTAGTTEDDTYAAQGGYGYTIEIGPENGAFHMPYKTGVVDEWTGDNPKAQGRGGLREALLIAGEAAGNTADHAILRGNAPAGATLRLHRDFETSTSKYCDLAPDPAVTVATPLDEILSCPGGVKDPQTLNDNLDSTTVVPASGAFEWHVNQSTRPFVGGGAVSEQLDDHSSRTDTITGGGPGTADPEDKPFTITADDQADVVKVGLAWDTPEDYDLEVYKGAVGDPNATKVASSGQPPGLPEEATLDHPATGDYFIRVVHYTALVGTWTATIERFRSTRTVTTGHKEAYKLTCEQGGAVVASHDVIIDRGQAIDMDPCGADASAQPAGGGGGDAGGGGSTPSVDGSAVSTVPAVGTIAPRAATSAKARAKAKAKARAKAKAKRIAKCRTKAKKIKSHSKRAKALKRCR